MEACIILHNLIIDDESEWDEHDYNYEQIMVPETNLPVNVAPAVDEEDFRVNRRDFVDDSFSGFVSRHRNIRDKQKHNMLKEDLIAHKWQLKGMNGASSEAYQFEVSID